MYSTAPIAVLPYSQAVLYYPNFIPTALSTTAYQTLTKQLTWAQYPIRMFGKTLLQPRLITWYGDKGVRYRYAQTELLADGWPPLLEQWRRQLETFVPASFNCVLANYYRDGQDSMSWHSDDEPELGTQPIIASISLGATRRLQFRHRQNHQQKAYIDLASGSLLIMKGNSQADWQHQIAKTKRVQTGRINLTYRYIG